MIEHINQWTYVTPDELLTIVQEAIAHNRPITIDWTNRTIQVLSEVKTHPTKVLSDGPMTYQDIIVSL